MTIKWMKEHAVKISVGFIVIVILMMFALPCICDHGSVIKDTVCVGTKCARSGSDSDSGASMSETSGMSGYVSGVKSSAKSLLESAKQKLRK